MTDKQIIIDEKCPISEKCKEFNNCKIQDILQQLKRKEQECEELKEEKQGLIKDWEEKKNLGYEIACKNEKLKQALEDIKSLCYEQDLNEDFFACEVLQKISECEEQIK